ncbi:hypothetical protein BK658_18975 [Pseudomonas brassicacearum]|uniref:Uncharacterized protein n=1 Tax=Pseudomonas brassicacearum TaxID=930166 RepID=A0A423GPM7_9PSED|nr:hypothetical protein BK658_18975 [Pseudomonas brassicacearum]
MLAQSIVLGFTQIAISVSVNALIAVMAGSIATFLASRPLCIAPGALEKDPSGLSKAPDQPP